MRGLCGTQACLLVFACHTAEDIANDPDDYQSVRQALRIVVANVGIIFEKCVVMEDFLLVFLFVRLKIYGLILASIGLNDCVLGRCKSFNTP